MHSSCRRQSIMLIAVGLAALALGLSACGAAPPSPSNAASPLVTSAPATPVATASVPSPSQASTTNPPGSSSADGTWTGETSQHQQFSVEVTGGRIRSYTIGFDYPECDVDSPILRSFGTPTTTVTAGSFALTDLTLYHVTISGRLGPGKTASGQAVFDLDQSFCGKGKLNLTWTATKVS
jgi:hypothetical protein